MASVHTLDWHRDARGSGAIGRSTLPVRPGGAIHNTIPCWIPRQYEAWASEVMPESSAALVWTIFLFLI